MSVVVKPRLAFVSTLFPQPEDTGGRIRTCNVLRVLKGGRFDVTLLAPASPAGMRDYADRLHSLCDRFVSWPEVPPPPRWRQVPSLFGQVPVSVTTSAVGVAAQAVRDELDSGHFDVVVFDFVHATSLLPRGLAAATVCFTHNVETEIFERHAERADSPLMKWIWSGQARKMRSYERDALLRYDRVIAVSSRDAALFRSAFGCDSVQDIPTGVDLDFFSYCELASAPNPTGGKVVFTGSMDWAANADGMSYFLREVWPLVLEQRPHATFEAVGRRPPAALLRLAESLPGVRFTGRVEDVRPHVRDAQVFVIPLLVGGGTRIKAYEAMAMGCPVVSTSLGVEGLEGKHGEHLLLADSPVDIAGAVLELLANPTLGAQLARNARALVQAQFGHRAVGEVFEGICWDTWQQHTHRPERNRA